MIIVGIDIAFQKHDYFMILKDTSVVFSSSYITIQNNERRGPSLPKKKTSEIQLLDEAEHVRLQNYVASHQNRNTLGSAPSMSTGIRIGELCALRWKDSPLSKT